VDLGICNSVVMDLILCWPLLARKDVQCRRINRSVEVFPRSMAVKFQVNQLPNGATGESVLLLCFRSAHDPVNSQLELYTSPGSGSYFNLRSINLPYGISRYSAPLDSVLLYYAEQISGVEREDSIDWRGIGDVEEKTAEKMERKFAKARGAAIFRT
jgi:hypothetical protein